MPLPLRQQVGQMFLVGLGGPALSPSERGWLRLLRPGGFILFRRNLEAAAQTAGLLREAAEAAANDGERIPALRALDLEGGLVDRLRDLIGPTPSAAAVAQAMGTGRSTRLAQRHGELIGRAARLFGFNATFAPVLDLALPPARPVMQTRVYGATSDEVVRYARPFLEALRAERILACGKHFPGLGGGALDSHKATPSIARGWSELWEEDIAPYRELKRLLPLIMVAHAVHPQVPQGGDAPASVSRFWIAETLRRRIGYEGLILSDDMEMGGLLSRMSIGEAAVAALLAGSDLLEVCKEPGLVFEAYEAVLAEAERSPSFRALVRRVSTRVREHKGRLLEPTLPRTPDGERLARLRGDLRLFTAEIEATQRACRAAEKEAAR